MKYSCCLFFCFALVHVSAAQDESLPVAFQQKPQPITKADVIGKFVFAYQTIYREIKIRRTNNYVFVNGSERIKGRWKIKNDTLYLYQGSTPTRKLIMKNGKFYFVSGNKTDLNAYIPKSDYKYYIRQCKKAGK